MYLPKKTTATKHNTSGFSIDVSYFDINFDVTFLDVLFNLFALPSFDKSRTTAKYKAGEVLIGM